MNVSKPSSKTGYFNFYNQSEPQREAVLKNHVLIISMLQLSPSKSNDLFRPPSLPVLPCSRWRDDSEIFSSFDGIQFSNISRIYGQTNKILDSNLTTAWKFRLCWSWLKKKNRSTFGLQTNFKISGCKWNCIVLSFHATCPRIPDITVLGA